MTSRAVTHGTVDRDALVISGLPTLRIIARSVASGLPACVEIDDLIQDGTIGLIDAASRYDRTRNVRFSTFSHQRIRGAMIDGIGAVTWPRSVWRRRQPLDWVNIDTLDDIPATAEPPVDVRLIAQAAASRVGQAVNLLPHRERYLIIAVYYYGQTFAHVALRFRCVESRIAAIHRVAIDRLRQWLQDDTVPLPKTPTEWSRRMECHRLRSAGAKPPMTLLEFVSVVLKREGPMKPKVLLDCLTRDGWLFTAATPVQRLRTLCAALRRLRGAGRVSKDTAGRYRLIAERIARRAA